MKTITLPGGSTLPALGLGTWRIGEGTRARAAEIAALRSAFERGYRVIDTAEMYGEGGAEEVVGQALAEAIRVGDVSREEIFVVGKVYPHNAGSAGVQSACERSRKRLRLDAIDLYLLHWRGAIPLQETVTAFRALREQHHIGRWGVSNFDVDDMTELWRLDGGAECAANQVYYSLTERGPDVELIPWQREHSIPMMAYSPIDQGALASDSKLQALARTKGITPAQLALAWVVSRPQVLAIPKAAQSRHLRENLAAADVELSAAELAEIERRFPAPRRKTALAMR